MSKFSSLLLFQILGFIVLVSGCKVDTSTVMPTPPVVVKSTGKAITTFVFGSLTSPVSASIDTVAATVKATLPTGTDLTKLVPTITVAANATVTPASGVVQDFSKPVGYTVTAQNSSIQAYVVTITAAVASTTATPGSSTVTSASANTGGFVYLGTDAGDFYAIDAGTGVIKWRVSSGSPILSSASSASGIVFVGNNGGNINAYDAQTGVGKWKFSTGKSIFSSPVAVSGFVYAGSEDQNIYAVDVAAGTLRWK